MSNSIYFSSMNYIVDIAANVAWIIRIKLFKFWTNFDVDWWLTDLVLAGRLRSLEIF